MSSKVVLSTSFVVVGVKLLSEPEQAQEFGRRADAGEILISAAASPVEVARTIRLDQVRMEVMTSENRTMVKKEYPSSLEDVSRLVNAIEVALNASELQEQAPVTALGYNIEVVYEPNAPDPVSDYIGRRMFSKVSSCFIGKDGWKLRGVSGAVAFEGENGERYNLTIEPRLRELDSPRAFLSINHHVPSNTLPSIKEIQVLLEDVWNTADRFIDSFDKICSE